MRPLSLLFALSLSSPAAAVPMQLTHQGRLYDSTGAPLVGAHQLHVALYAQASGGAPIWSDTVNATLDAGVFSIVLGATGGAALDSDVFDGSVRWLGLAVDAAAELPDRIALVSVPYAIRAESAAVADGLAAPLDWSQVSGAPADADSLADLSCVDGQVPTWQGAAWSCASPVPASVDVASLTGTIDIDNLPVGSGASQVAAGDHVHSFGQITGELGLDRTNGDLPLSRTTGDLSLSRTTGDLPVARLAGELPLSQTTGSLDIAARTTGDLPLSRTSGSLDLATRSTGSIDIGRTTGNIPYTRLPVGTVANTVAAGNHTHTAAEVGALPAPLGSGTLALPGAVRLGDASVDCTVSSNAGTLFFDDGALKACADGDVIEFASGRLRLDNGAYRLPGGGMPKSCKGYIEHASYRNEGDARYWIDPASNGTGFRAWCDMTTAPGGWTRVSQLSLQASGCVLSAAAAGDPGTSAGSCTKYADSVINQIAEEKIYFARFGGYPSTYTKYENQIRINGNSGRVVQADSYAAVASAALNRTPGYSGWLFFHQQDWYQSDTCIGTAPATHRLSLEYIVSSGNLYTCSGGCTSNCPSGNLRGSSEVYLR